MLLFPSSPPFADELTDGARTGIATAAGAVSGIVTGPPELIMIQQQKLGGTLGERLRLVVQEHGILSLTRGVVRIAHSPSMEGARLRCAAPNEHLEALPGACALGARHLVPDLVPDLAPDQRRGEGRCLLFCVQPLAVVLMSPGAYPGVV